MEKQNLIYRGNFCKKITRKIEVFFFTEVSQGCEVGVFCDGTVNTNLCVCMRVCVYVCVCVCVCVCVYI